MPGSGTGGEGEAGNRNPVDRIRKGGKKRRSIRISRRGRGEKKWKTCTTTRLGEGGKKKKRKSGAKPNGRRRKKGLRPVTNC